MLGKMADWPTQRRVEEGFRVLELWTQGFQDVGFYSYTLEWRWPKYLAWNFRASRSAEQQTMNPTPQARTLDPKQSQGL